MSRKTRIGLKWLFVAQFLLAILCAIVAKAWMGGRETMPNVPGQIDVLRIEISNEPIVRDRPRILSKSGTAAALKALKEAKRHPNPTTWMMHGVMTFVLKDQSTFPVSYYADEHDNVIFEALGKYYQSDLQLGELQ